MKRHAGLITALSLVIGIGLFLFVIRQTGSRELLHRVEAAGWGFLWLLIISGLRPMARSYAWLRCLNERDRQVGFFSVWRARLIGDAVGNLTAAGPLLAEPARLMFFTGRVPMAAAAASLSIELLTYLASSLVLMVTGLALLLSRFALSSSIREVAWLAFLSLFGALGISTIALVRRLSLSALLGKLLKRGVVGNRYLEWIDAQLARLYVWEQQVFDFYYERPRDFLWVCLCEALFHLSGVIEIWFTLALIGESATPVTAFIFEAVNRLLTMIFSFVPTRVGVDEAGTGLLAPVLGFAALIGVALAVYRKLRIFFWTAVGLVLLATHLKAIRRADQ
jgi:hypothetical protein